MRGCRTIRDRLILLASGELDGPELEMVADHMGQCAACGERLLEIQETGESLDQRLAALPLLSAEFDRHVALALRVAEPLPAPHPWRRVVAIAASLTVAFIGGWLVARKVFTAPLAGIMSSTSLLPPARGPRRPTTQTTRPDGTEMVRNPVIEGMDLAQQLVDQGKPHQVAEATRIYRALARRRLDDLESSDRKRRAAGRSFFREAGRHWLLMRLDSPSPDERILAAVRRLYPAGEVGRPWLDRWLAHPLKEVRRLALHLGAVPRRETVGRWLELSRADEVARAKLLAAGPGMLLAALGGKPLPGHLLLAARGSDRWLRGLAQLATPAAQAVLDRVPAGELLALCESHTDSAASRSGLVAAVCRRPVPGALLLLLRSSEDPSLADLAKAGLSRWLDRCPPEVLIRALGGLAGGQVDQLRGAALSHRRRLQFLEALGGVEGQAMIELTRLDARRARPLIEEYLEGSAERCAVGVAASFLDLPSRYREYYRRLLRSKDPTRCRLGLVSLALAWEPGDLALMMFHTRHDDPAWNRLIWACVTRLAADEAPGILRRRIMRRQMSGRAEALERLARLGEPLRPTLEMALSDPDPAMRRTALRLTQRPASELQLTRIRVLSRKDQDAKIRAEAYRAMGRLSPPRAVRWIAKGLEDAKELPAVRRSAADALARLGDPRAIQFLQRRLEDPAVATACAEGLMLLTAHHMPLPEGATPGRMKEYQKRWRRWLVAHESQSIAALHKAALASGNARRQALAVRALSQSGDPRGMLDVLHAWRQAAPAQRRKMLEALGIQGPARDLASLGAVIERVREDRAEIEPAASLLTGDAPASPIVRLRWQPVRLADQLVAGMSRSESTRQRLARRGALRRMTGLALAADWIWPVWWGAVRDRF